MHTFLALLCAACALHSRTPWPIICPGTINPPLIMRGFLQRRRRFNCTSLNLSVGAVLHRIIVTEQVAETFAYVVWIIGIFICATC